MSYMEFCFSTLRIPEFYTEWNSLPTLFQLINDLKQMENITIFIVARKNGYIPISFSDIV